jgi:inward rectifier potassium channel
MADRPSRDPHKRAAAPLVVRGRVTVQRYGLERRLFADVYHHLLTKSWTRLFVIITSAFLVINALFAGLYMLEPGSIEAARGFGDYFFFSVQTMGTIGYGHMLPRTVYANVLVTAQAILSLASTALATGLVFSKFARPTARVMWSRVAVVAPRDGVMSLMFRMANRRANQIVEADLHLVLARNELTKEGESVRRFYDLALARSRSALFALSWTAIHPIDERSPLFGETQESMVAKQTELIASLTGLDETFAQTVHSRYSYQPGDLVWHARFADILHTGEDGRSHVDYTYFHDVKPLEAPRA